MVDGDRAHTKSERLVIEAIRQQLRPGELLVENLRLTDSHAGDVEIDVAVLVPDLGIAVIEVKGGQIEFRDGQWISRTATGTRRINPVEQARRGKHALRSYLMRQGVTGSYLAHTEWFIAMPHTVVDGDMGPEAVSEALIGSEDIPRTMEVVRRRLSANASGQMILNASQIEAALTLLQTQTFEPQRMTPDEVKLLAKYGSVVLGYSTLAFFIAELVWVSLVAGIWATIVIGAISWWAGVRFFRQHLLVPRHIVWVNIAAVLLGLALGDELAHVAFIKEMRGCNSNYASCVPQDPQVTCAEIGDEVEVLGRDEYSLDPNANGIACEWKEFIGDRK